MAEPKATIVSDAEKAAIWIATALNASGYKVDFSVLSLREIERFFVEHAKDGKPKPGGLLAQDTGARLFALGSYVGEVIRREVRASGWRPMAIQKRRSTSPYVCQPAYSCGLCSAS